MKKNKIINFESFLFRVIVFTILSIIISLIIDYYVGLDIISRAIVVIVVYCGLFILHKYAQLKYAWLYSKNYKKQKQEVKQEKKKEIKYMNITDEFKSLSKAEKNNLERMDKLVSKYYMNIDYHTFKDLPSELRNNKYFVIRYIKYSKDSQILKYCGSDVVNDIDVALISLFNDIFCYEHLGNNIKTDSIYGLNLLNYVVYNDSFNYVIENIDEEILKKLNITKDYFNKSKKEIGGSDYVEFFSSKFVKNIREKYLNDNFDIKIQPYKIKGNFIKNSKNEELKIKHADIISRAKTKVKR